MLAHIWMTMSQLAPSTLSSIIRRCVSRGAAADARLLSSLAAQTSTHAHAYSTFVTAHGSELVGSSCPTSNGQHHAVACMCPSCVRSMMCASSSGASRHPFASRAYASAADAGKTAADQRDAKASTSNQQEPSTDKDARSSSGKAAEGAESSGSEPEATPEELMAQLKEQEAAAGKLTEQVWGDSCSECRDKQVSLSAWLPPCAAVACKALSTLTRHMRCCGATSAASSCSYAWPCCCLWPTSDAVFAPNHLHACDGDVNP